LYKIPAITLFLGKNLKFVPECQSTNDLMQQLCQTEQLSEGSLIITANQVAGRGQRGNSWETEPGRNLTFSLYFRPAFLPVTSQFLLNIFVSLAIADFISTETGKKVHIKWPNDLLLEEKKVCGVLIENQLVGQKLSGSIIGIGLNVNQQRFPIPTATSMSLETGAEWDLQYALDNLLSCLEARYIQLREGKSEALKAGYLERLFRINQEHQFATNTGSFRGTIKGIDEIGRLLIAVDGAERSFDKQEIKFAGW
jgi:BirA family transcriptional regulator, biotin operon repressor / biotin---[acetyl-CoA-carboxylase] ligase